MVSSKPDRTKSNSEAPWISEVLKLSEKDDFKRRLQFIKKESSSDAFTIMESLSDQYEKKYDFPREMPWEVISSV